MIKVDGSRWPFPSAARRAAVLAARVAVTAEVEVSGPAIAKGNELRKAMTAAAMVADRKVAAMPYDSQCAKGPEKMSAAYDRQ
jgi:hypothetical protein